MMMSDWMKLPNVEAGVEEVQLVTAVYSKRRRDYPVGPFRRRSRRNRGIELQVHVTGYCLFQIPYSVAQWLLRLHARCARVCSFGLPWYPVDEVVVCELFGLPYVHSFLRRSHCLTPFVYGSDGIIYGSDATVGVTHTSDEEWEEGEQGDVFHGEEDESLSGGGEVDGDGCGQEEDNGGVEVLCQGFELVHAG
ncbi:hypothetical protein LR48_Vigan10g276000 [Vigna angularis]|uniref:Uncharacterized protein n=1 Tax=Phaseolus angularis TaxID=3914 RepID=A0A0L9VPH3_PHAAN|nr:hypothetical protein LR48_Vigan10g276000 [Vigna angularis]